MNFTTISYLLFPALIQQLPSWTEVYPRCERVFDSGASGTNRIEAKAVCDAIIKHAKINPK